MEHADTRNLHRKALAAIMAFVMAFSLVPLPAHAQTDLAAGGIIIQDAQSGSVIYKLTGDMESNESLVIAAGTTYTLDLDGHTYKRDITVNGTLVLNSAGTIEGTVTVSSNGTLDASAGTVKGAVANGGTATFAGATVDGAISNRGTLTASSGTFKGAINTTAGTTNLTGGTFEGKASTTGGVTNIEGGAFKADDPVSCSGGTTKVTGGEFDHGDKVPAPSGPGVLYPKGKALVKGSGESTYTVQPTLAAFTVTFSPESAIIEPGGHADAPTVTVEPYDGLAEGAVTLGENDAVITFGGDADLPNPTEPGEYEVKATGAEGSAFAGTAKSAEKKFKVEHGVVACTNGSTTQNYTKFTEALEFANKASVATTMKLFDNVNLASEGASNENLVYVNNKVVLDLNGHTLTTPDNVFRPEGSTAELTITDTSEGANGVFTAAGTVLRARKGAKIVIEKGTIQSTAISENVYYNAISVLNGCSITMNGGAIEAVGSAIMSSGQASAEAPTYGNDAKITVQGGTISSQKECAIYAPAVGGQTTIEGGTITGATGIELRAGRLAVTGGSITGTATSLQCTSNSDGATTCGAGIAIVQHLTEDNMEVAISGNPTIAGYHALYQNQADGAYPEKIKLSVSGGTFDGARGQDAVLVKSTTVKNSVGDALHFISGGLFSSDPSKLLGNSGAESNYVASDKRVIGDGSKWYYSVGAPTVAKPAAATASFTYDGAEHAPFELSGYEGYVADPNASTVKAANVGNYSITFYPAPGLTWTDGTSAGHEVAWSIKPCSLANASLAVQTASFTYDGAEHEPSVQVIAGDRVVNPGDYTLEYYRGSETSKLSGAPSAAGTYTVVATAKSANYSNSTAKGTAATFVIEQAEVASPNDLVNVSTSLIYNGSAQTGVTLKDSASWATLTKASATEAGKHTATVALDGNHKWAAGVTGDVEFTIGKASIATIELSKTSAEFTGSNVAPTVTAKDANGSEVGPSHFEAVFTKQGTTTASAQVIEAGTYDVTVTAKDDNYFVATTAKATFTVTPKQEQPSNPGQQNPPSTTEKTVAQPAAKTNLVYTGQSQTGVSAATGYTLSGTTFATEPGAYEATAKLDSGYTWASKTGSEATADLTIRWTIAKRTVAVPTGAKLAYSGKSQVVVPVGSGYSLSLPRTGAGTAQIDSSGNAIATEVGTGAVNATLSDVSHDQWAGGVTGSVVQVAWEIKSTEEQKPSESVDDVTATLSATSFTYTGEQIKPVVTVTGTTDYSLRYGENKNAGTGYVYVTYKKDNNSQTITKTFTIGRAPISSVTSSTSNREYTGKAIKPKVTVKAATGTLASGADYSVKYQNNTKVGTATITVTGKGNYSGTVKRSFRIVPKPTSLTKLIRAKKGFSVKWSKQTAQTSGYQVQYSQSKSFAGAAVTSTLNKNTTLSKSFKVAKSGARYYVHVRTYKTVRGQRYYSTWSATKPVKTK